MPEDPEIKAMADIAKLLSELETADARGRVIRWVAQRFAVGSAATQEAQMPKQDALEDTDFQEFADLYDQANPGTEAERVLVGAYWFQVVLEQPTMTGYEVNRELKNLGHGVGNVTVGFTSLSEQDPRLAMQLQKSGKARQARKKYKLTVAGIRTVKGMLAKQSGGNSGS